ncbi:MAG: aldo/keto reductase [Planctomycetes bacterium]|nr:aldo/keto reductase [Planctomycetota bacterium]
MNEKIFQPRRVLGRTGFCATQLGIGDLADRTAPLEQCVATARRALDAGLNVIDTAPSYEDGYSEQIVGRAIKGRRDEIFLIDKIDHHDEPVGPQLENSLRLLEEDHVDLMVFHGLSTLDGWRKVAAGGGGMEHLTAQVKAGKVRFRGISSHNPEVLAEAINSGLCDVVMFSVGPFCDERYVEKVLPLARQKSVGTVCFKTFGAGKLLGDTSGYGRPLQERPRGKFSSGGSDAQGAQPQLPCLTAGQCVRYTLTIDPDVALLGMSFPNEQDAAFAAARDFKPMSPDELLETRRQARQAMQQKGPAWWNPQQPSVENVQ